MSEQNEVNQQVKYNEKYNFFELDNGLRVPGVGIVKLYQKLYPNYISLYMLYALKTGKFVTGLVEDKEEEDDFSDYSYNKIITYRVPIGNYVDFGLEIVPDLFINIKAQLIEVYVENVDKLIYDEEMTNTKVLDEINSLVYFQQMNNLKNTTVLTARLIELARDLTKRINENNDYSIEIPRLYPAVVYDWKEIKQMVLNLRQPLDPDL
ncbi:MAG: hypothetical protein QXO77_05375 [Saccharolobus sp.]